jgi:hypothetical protein
VRALYLSWEDVIAQGIDGGLVGISELEATVHGWSSESVLDGSNETTHVDTLSRAERISQVSLSWTVPLREQPERAWADATVKYAESATMEKSCLTANIISRSENW